MRHASSFASFLAGCALFAAGAAQAQVTQSSVTVSDAWARATVAQQKSSAAYMQISSKHAARIVAVSTPAAGSAEIHEMKMDGDVMRMRAVDALNLPAGQAVSLAPGGYHVMLMDLKKALKPGDTLALTLVVEGADHKRENVAVQATVRAADGQAPAPSGHHQH